MPAPFLLYNNFFIGLILSLQTNVYLRYLRLLKKFTSRNSLSITLSFERFFFRVIKMKYWKTKLTNGYCDCPAPLSRSHFRLFHIHFHRSFYCEWTKNLTHHLVIIKPRKVKYLDKKIEHEVVIKSKASPLPFTEVKDVFRFQNYVFSED